MTMTDYIIAAFHAGCSPREVLTMTGASKNQVNAYLDSIRKSQREIYKAHGRAILPIWPNL